MQQQSISKGFILYLLAHFLLSSQVQAQVGGRQTFEFLRIPRHARLAGLGGVNVSLHQGDVNMFGQNPALLDDEMARKASFSYVPWHADINQFSLSYVQPFAKLKNIGFALQVLSYGQFERNNAAGLNQGTFQASDFSLEAAYAFSQDNFSYGLNVKLLGSQIDNFNAYALAFDLGAVFKHPNKDFSLGLVIKNLGFPLSKYTPDARTNLPFDVQLGASFKPTYMPLRFSLSLHHLYQFDIVYLDPSVSQRIDANGNPIPEEKTFFDKLARHFVFGAELLLVEGFNIRVGYNHLINREFRLEGLGGLRGFSFGANLKIKSFGLAYSYGTYFPGAGRSFLSLSTDFNTLFKKRKVVN